MSMSRNPKTPNPQLPRCEAGWGIASLIDFEIAVRRDEESSARERDRDFYLALEKEKAAPELLAKRAWVFRRWLETRRRELTAGDPTPGEEAASMLSVFTIGGGAFMFLFFAMITWGALAISGQVVNVVNLGLVVIGVPFMLSLFGFYLVLNHQRPQRLPPPLLFRGFLVRTLARGARTAIEHGRAYVTGEQGLSTRVWVSALKMRMSDRGGSLSAVVTNAVHLVGLAAVIGVFAALFWFKNSSSQSYGWQSHGFLITEGSVGRVVPIASWPWRLFAGEGVGYPTAKQVRETHYFRGDDLRKFDPDHSASFSWSAFLVLASLFYGVLPRGILYLMGRRVRIKALAEEDFSQHRFDDLWRRMTRPIVTIQPPPPNGPLGNGVVIVPPEANIPNDVTLSILLIPPDVRDQENEICAALTGGLGIEITERRSFPALPTPRKALLDDVAGLLGAEKMELLIVQRAFITPSREFLRFLGDCRDRLGARASLHVVLIGKSSDAGAWEAPIQIHRADWSDHVAKLADAHLSTIFLEPPVRRNP